VSNLPFGQQRRVPGDKTRWLAAILAEIARVTRPGGRVVLLAPQITRQSVPAELQVTIKNPIRLLGTKTTVWVFDKP
jgi:tRNA G10  N-methylase Trm11